MSESAPTAMTDQIVLTLPARAGLRGVATLVLGGIGSRLDLPYEKVDDLQLAVLSVLASNDVDAVTFEIEVGEELLAVTIGPLSVGTAEDPGLQRVLGRLVDAVETASRQGDDGVRDWVTLQLERHPSEPA